VPHDIVHTATVVVIAEKKPSDSDGEQKHSTSGPQRVQYEHERPQCGPAPDRQRTLTQETEDAQLAGCANIHLAVDNRRTGELYSNTGIITGAALQSREQGPF
jgi:hypothetical protein